MYKQKLLAKALTFFCILLSVFFLYTGCNNRVETPGAVDLAEILQLSSEGGVIDFGMVEAESGTKQLSVTMTNTGTEAVTVSEALLSDTTNYTITTETLPLTIEPGTETTVTGDFHPQTSGTIEATISVTAAGITEPLTISLTGSGNYPPEVVSGYMVLDDGEADVSGFFTQIGEKNAKPMYKRTTGEDMYLYYVSDPTPGTSIIARALQDEGQGWIVNSSPDITIYSGLMNGYGPDAETPEGTQNDGWNSPVLEVKAETKPYIVDEDPGLYVGDTLTVYYGYSDKDGDLEGDTSYQWYRRYVEATEWTVINGATNKTYQLQGEPFADINCYIKCSVTPKASSGITDGIEVFSEATSDTVSTGQFLVAE